MRAQEEYSSDDKQRMHIAKALEATSDAIHGRTERAPAKIWHCYRSRKDKDAPSRITNRSPHLIL
jgi:hypothetical protein